MPNYEISVESSSCFFCMVRPSHPCCEHDLQSPGQRGATMTLTPFVTRLVPLASPLPEPHSDEAVGDPALEIHQLFHAF